MNPGFEMRELWQSRFNCSEYFDDFANGWLCSESQCPVIFPLSEVEDRGDFLSIGSAGVDGISFGYRHGEHGIFAHYPVDGTYVFIAENLVELISKRQQNLIHL